jgi:hypothetical protein
MLDIIQLTETSRLGVEVDEDAVNPRTEGDVWLTGFVKVGGRGDSRLIDVEPVHSWPELDDAIERLLNIEEEVPRWAAIFHGMHVEYDAQHGGFWFVDPAALAENWPTGEYPDGKTKAEWERELIAREQETYRQWADGEVYGVILQRQETWCRLLDDGTADRLDTRDEWADVESIWGCYLDDGYTAQQVADDYFDLTDEDAVALGISG